MSSEAAKKAWATRRAKRKERTPLQRVTAILSERSRWLRKETIARNKLKKVQAKLEALLDEVVSQTNRELSSGTYNTMFSNRKIVK